MKGTEFDELAFFAAVARSGARALLIGRRALVVLGLPVLTADYDFWIAFEDIERFNAASEPFDLVASHPPDQARQRGRYVLENDERIDVLIARGVPTVDGVTVRFDDVWNQRSGIELAPGVTVVLPSIDDLILTKKFAARPRDIEDIRMLELLKKDGQP